MGDSSSNHASTLKPAVVNARGQAAPPYPELPDEPLVVIQPGRSWGALSFRELWHYRELLYFMIWRDVKVRYKQTALGAAWAVMQPFFMMLIFTLFFGRLAGVPSDGLPYPVFAYAALLPWTFFSNAVTASGNSLIGSSNLITKVYFPRAVIPIAAVGAGLVDFAIAFAVFLGMMFYYDMALTWRMLALPAALALIALLAAGVGMWMSALNVKYRDVRYALPFLLQLWMFASPIIYPPSIVPANWRWVLALNPLAGIINGFRSALLGRGFDWPSLAVSAAITLALLLCAALYFRRMEREFADII